MTPSPDAPEHRYEVQGNRLIFHRDFAFPRALVYQAWTDSAHLDHWWGPLGFRNTTEAFDFRIGGVWQLIMHGPDGTDYPNRLRYTTITPNERIEYRHDAGRDDDPSGFDVTVDFIELSEGMTRVTMCLAFASPETAQQIVEGAGAIEGHRGTMLRLERFVPVLIDREVSTKAGFLTITRILQAPRGLVWRAWTEADMLACWFGPEAFTVPHCTVDPRVGGKWHLAMQAPDGNLFWCGGEYCRIEAPSQLVYRDFFSNEAGETVSPEAFGMPDYPMENLLTVDFEALSDESTRITLTSSTDIAIALKYMADLGWSSSLVKLELLLAESLS